MPSFHPQFFSFVEFSIDFVISKDYNLRNIQKVCSVFYKLK